ncbi:MAG TPA: STAS domain-containing protein, partial [Roseiflexaceae bacterium]|nr:STAS domain-containing protein [Roseiflexaceae bacterium]
MLANVQDWMAALPIGNPLRYRQARLLQTMLLSLLLAIVFFIILSVANAGRTASYSTSVIIFSLMILTIVAGIILLRRGMFSSAVYLVSIGISLDLGVALLITGLLQNQLILFSFAVPMTLAGLLIGRRGLLIITSLIALIVLSTGLLHVFAPTLVGFASNRTTSPVSIVLSFILSAIVLSFLLDRFGSAMHEALHMAQEREQELEHLRVSLESTVAERTASLQEIVNELRTSQQTIQQLSAPIMPVLPGVLVAPLIGSFDNHRAAMLNEHVLQAVDQTRARYVIFDITGITAIDTHVVQL